MLSGVYDGSTGTPVLSVAGRRSKGPNGTIIRLADGRTFSFPVSGDRMTAIDDAVTYG